MRLKNARRSRAGERKCKCCSDSPRAKRECTSGGVAKADRSTGEGASGRELQMWACTPLRRRVRVKFAPRLHSASSHSQKNCVDVEAVLNANSNLYLGVYPHRLCFFERGPQAEIAFVFFNAARREEPRLRALAYACGRRFHLCALDLTRPRRRKGGRSAAPCLGQRQCASPSARSVLR